jgi:hypothetical protein
MIGADSLDQRLRPLIKTRTDKPGIATRCIPGDPPRFQDCDGPSPAGDFERRRQPG